MSFRTIGSLISGAIVKNAIGRSLVHSAFSGMGFFIGMMVFDALFPERPSSEAGKLNDLMYQGSSYGTPWPRVWGTARMGGQVSYMHKNDDGTYIKEIRVGASFFSHSHPEYVVNDFVGFCQATLFFPDNDSPDGGTILHRGHRIKRIWANQSELIYEEEVEGVITTNPYNLVCVKGTETQSADSDIATLEGTGSNTPANRGICGVYCKGLNLSNTKFNNTVPQLSAEIATDAVTVGDVLSDICQLHGLSSSRIDVSACTDTLTGFVWNSREQGRNPIEQILVAYDIDLVDVDGKLKFIPRSAASTFELSEDLLGASSNGRSFKFSRKHPNAEDRPTRVSIFYIDPDSSYNQGTAEATRQTVYDGSDYSLSTTLVLTASQAEIIARRMLDRFWTEMDEVTITVPMHGCIYAPGDKITTSNNGVPVTFRITSMILGPIGEVTLTGPVVDDDTLVQTVTGSSGNSDPTPVTVVPSLFTAFSSREILDEHQATAGFYVAASGAANWLNGQVWYLPPGGTEYVQGPTISSRCVFGSTTSTLDDTGAVAETFDMSNTVDVDLTASLGSLDDYEEVAVEQGNNIAWIGDEIAGFATAGLTSTYNYTLSDILRGLRGSTMSGHTSSDRFVLATSAVQHIGVPDSHVGLDYDVKVLSPGETLSDVTAVTVTIVARTPTATEDTLDSLSTAQYVTMATSSTLANERVLTAGSGVSITDGGAGSTVTVAASHPVRTETTTYAVLITDETVFADTSGGSWTATLPTAVGNSGKEFIVKNVTSDANTLTVNTTGGQTIDGAASVTTVPTAYTKFRFKSDGANWWLI